MLYEMLNIKNTSDLREFGEEIAEKCSRLLYLKRFCLKIVVEKPTYFLVGFKDGDEAEKIIKNMKDRGNVFFYEFENGYIYIEISERLNCNLRRLVLLLSKRIEEIVEKILAEENKIKFERLKTLVNSIPDAVVILDYDGRIVEYNMKFLEITGLTPSIIGNKIQKYFEHEKEKFEKTLELWKRRKLNKIKIKIGSKYFEGNPGIIEDENKIIVIFRDVTDIELINKRLQKLVDCLRSCIFMKDENLRYILVNNSFSKFVNKPKEEIIGKNDLEVLPPELANKFRELDLEILKTKKSSNFEVQINKNGTKYFEGYELPIVDSGNVKYIVGVIRDVTDKKIVENLKRLKTLLDYSEDIIFVVDDEWKIVDMNYKAKELLKNYQSDDIKSIIKGSWTEKFEGYISDKVFLINVKSAIFNDKKYRIIIAKDITELKKIEKKLKDMNKQLKFMNRLLRHDISNNITAIIGFLEAYRETGKEIYLDKIESIIDSCIELISNVRDIENALKEELKIIDIKYILERSLENIKNKNVNVSLKIKCDDMKVKADNLVYSVFDNILKNAIQHNPEKNKIINVEVTCDEKFVIVKIADNGQGIPDKFKKYIFDKGFKYGKNGRTGMGLYIVKLLMDKYGGEVEVKDNKPKGSIFVLKFRK